MKRIVDLHRRLSAALALLLMIWLGLIPFSLYAGAVGELNVRSAVQTWIRSVTADARPNAFIERMQPFTVDGEIRAYIAHLAGAGFCLCGADESVLPVYFYSPGGTYDPAHPEYRFILDEISTRMKFIREASARGDNILAAHQQELSERASLWRQLISGNVVKRAGGLEGVRTEPDSMSLPLTSIWGQGSPYNDQCPELTPGIDEHTLVGCVATALSQIMYYWKWPTRGVSSHTGSPYNYRYRTTWDEEPLSADPGIPTGWSSRLAWTSSNGGRLRMNGYWEAATYSSAKAINTSTAYLQALDSLYSHLTAASTTTYANFGATTYQWSLMQDQHTDPVDAGDGAVATLCYQVAVGVDMDFGLTWSGSDLWRAYDNLQGQKPLADFFLYDPDLFYGHANMASLTTEDIMWLRPVAFSGSGPPGGHAWVAYGYNKGTDPNRQFKMNMGWSGGSDGWYSLDNVPLGITQNLGYLVDIAPKDKVQFVGNTTSGDGSPAQPYQGISQAVSSAASGTTLIFKAGSDNTFPAPLTITKALTLKGRNVTIRKQ
jgi:hypothetical protein